MKKIPLDLSKIKITIPNIENSTCGSNRQMKTNLVNWKIKPKGLP